VVVLPHPTLQVFIAEATWQIVQVFLYKTTNRPGLSTVAGEKHLFAGVHIYWRTPVILWMFHLQSSVGRYQKFYATIRIVKKYRDTRYYRDT